MKHLIYCSETTSLSLETVKDIAKKANERNLKKGLTGLLFFNSEKFLQILEGEERVLNDTYHKIARDPRHRNLYIIDYGTIISRSFHGWGMGFASDKMLNREIYFKYLPSDHFDPYQLPKEAAFRFLVELAMSVQSLNLDDAA